MKKFFTCITVLILCFPSYCKSNETLLLVSGIPYQFDERVDEIVQRPVLFSYDYTQHTLDSIMDLSPQKVFMNLNSIELYNTFGYLVVLKSFFENASQMLSIIDLNTMKHDSIIIEGGITSESNLFVLNSDSIYYCVCPINTGREKGFNKFMKSKDFEPQYYNYSYIQGQVGAPINDREFLILYNEKTNDNALHISKGGGYGLKVGPYLEIQPPKDIYNSNSPALKSIRINDSHCMVILYDYSKPESGKIGEKYFLIYDKENKNWYKRTFRGTATSIRSYDNGWITGTIKEKDKGRYFDKMTVQYGETYDFKRKTPGYEVREPIFYTQTDGVWGDCFDERIETFGTYYPGLLFLFNVHTKSYIEWDTKQGDSEILLVQEGFVYYRVNTKILKSSIINNNQLSNPELLLDDVRVRDIHWAYLKKSKE